METKVSATRIEKRKKRQTSAWQLAGSILIIILGIGLFYGGYLYSEQRLTAMQLATEENVAAAMTEIQETNALNLRALEGTIDAIMAEVEEISFALIIGD